MKSEIIILLVLLVAVPLKVPASTSQETTGARPAAMAGAFVGVADDGNALYWNPAGMAFLNHHEITSMHSDLFGLGIGNDYLAYTYPLTSRLAVGLDWFNLGFSDPELEYTFNKFNFGGSYKVTSRASVGLTLKHLNTSTSFDARSLGSGRGWTGDIGVLYRVADKLSVGATFSNISNGWITYDNGSKSQMYDVGLRVGVGYRPINQLLLACDISDRFHLGGEYGLLDVLFLRGGVQRDLSDDKETILSFGLGVKYSSFQIDYAYTSYPYLNSTSRISLSAFFNFGHSLVRVNSIQLTSERGLFPSLWNSYRQSPALAFELQNRSDKPLQCTWAVDIEEMTDAPTTGEVILRPRETKTIYASTQLADKFFENLTDQFQPGILNVTYVSGRESKTESRKFQTFIYARSAIDWAAGVNRISSFINPQDAQIRMFTSNLVGMNADLIKSDGPFANLHKGIAIVNGLRSYGLEYLSDPSNPFVGARGESGGIDNIQYPVELLNSRRGDCDDLTALVCAMFESIGIETVVLDVPGHLFMMFDAGLPDAYRISMMLEGDWVASYRGRVFIPVEMTEVAGGFFRAWSAGASEYHRLAAMSEVNEISVREAWQSYPPAPLSLALDEASVNRVEGRAGTQADLASLADLNRQFLARNYYGGIERLASDPGVLNKMAVLAVLDGDLDEGEKLLREVLAAEPSKIDARLNLANVMSLKGNSGEARTLYESLIDREAVPELLVNSLMASCLSSGSGETEMGMTLANTYHRFSEGLGAGEAIPSAEIRLAECARAASSGIELAVCVRRLLNDPTLPADKASKDDWDLQDSIESKARLFLWLY